MYPDEGERAALAASITANPAFLAMLGPVGSTSVGGLTAWRIGVLAATMIGLMTIFTVIGRTRADEEAGRTELLMAGVVGRSAQLVAAVVTAAGAALIIGVVVAAAGIAQGTPVTGVDRFGCGVRRLWMGVRGSRGGHRAAGRECPHRNRDGRCRAGCRVRDPGGGDTVDGWDWLQWLSPQGWVTRVNAYGTDQVVVLGLFLPATMVLLAIAVLLLHRRDVGLALFPARLGAAGNPRLNSPEALAVRLHRGSLTGWAVGFAAFGAITGGIAASAGDLINSSPQLARSSTGWAGQGC